MLRFGPPDGPVVVVAPALFEEANRTRAFLVRILRLLAADGIASILPDLPGTGESLRPTVDGTLDGWRSSYAAAVRAANRPALAFAVRGGALVDSAAEVIGRYHLSSVTGVSVVRDLVRVRQAAAREDGERFDPAELRRPGPPVLLAGNLINRALLAELSKVEPLAGSRTVRLATDPYPANLRLEGRPLWRASEPSVDVSLAEAVATDLAAWVRRCVA
jgi:pimeloyl-ACP methyl ester carboxylesterase